MWLKVLLVAHVAVLGYWLGAELVINRTFRFVSHAASMPFQERTRLMDHVMQVDQHVRFALVLQAGIGTALAALLGYLPGGVPLAWIAGAACIGWLVFVEAAHRMRHRPGGARLARIDRGSRYLLLGLLLATSLGLVGGQWAMPDWLRIKLGLFAAVIACGVGIRLVLARYFRIWAQAARDGADEGTNARILRSYWHATAVLVPLWGCIAAIVLLSLWKPA